MRGAELHRNDMVRGNEQVLRRVMMTAAPGEAVRVPGILNLEARGRSQHHEPFRCDGIARVIDNEAAGHQHVGAMRPRAEAPASGDPITAGDDNRATIGAALAGNAIVDAWKQLASRGWIEQGCEAA